MWFRVFIETLQVNQLAKKFNALVEDEGSPLDSRKHANGRCLNALKPKMKLV
jgi:hypothetical protein